MGVGLLLALTASLTLSGPAEADNIGSMNTTDTGCVAVNINHYDLKTDVWLAGKNFQPGLPLYFKVTSPSGTPLGDDNGVPKAVEPDGSFCLQLWAQVVMSNDGVTQGYLDTDNDGNEYKVTVSTTPDFDPTKSDNFKVEACEGDCGEQPTPADDPTASKDATPSFDRTYSWSVAKTADKTVVKQAGGTVTVNYTVTATMTGYTDSNYAVSGTVTVTNPNAADITGASVADDVTGCSITDPATNVTLAPGPNAFAYSCVFTDTSKEANTATVTWPTQDVDGHELVGGSTTTDPATWDWDTVVPDEVDECVTVTDAFDGGAAVSLGSACRAESPKAFTYSRTSRSPRAAAGTTRTRPRRRRVTWASRRRRAGACGSAVPTPRARTPSGSGRTPTARGSSGPTVLRRARPAWRRTCPPSVVGAGRSPEPRGRPARSSRRTSPASSTARTRPT